MRWTKWVAPMAALVLMAGFAVVNARAADTATANGKATVTVTVVDAAGQPVVGASIALQPAPAGKKGAGTQPGAAAGGGGKKGGGKGATAIANGTTGADGTYALQNIPDGNFVVVGRQFKSVTAVMRTLLDPPRLEQRAAEATVGSGMIRVQLNRLGKVIDRAFEIAGAALLQPGQILRVRAVSFRQHRLTPKHRWMRQR